MTMGAKTCACGCGESLDGLRSDARWYSEAHRKAATRRDAACGHLPAITFIALWKGYRAIRRRPSPDRGRTWATC